MKSSLGKYKIGLTIIAVFSLILLALMISQAGATKQDSQTYASANKIVTKLNNYVSSKQAIPASLSAVGATNVPSTITYQKLSDSSYKFCATYKTKSSDFNAANVESDLITEEESGTGSSNYGSDYSNAGDLYLDPSHDKGQNCQTIKAQVSNYGSSSDTDGSSDPYAKCDSIASETVYNQCVESIESAQGTTDDNGNSTYDQ